MTAPTSISDLRAKIKTAIQPVLTTLDSRWSNGVFEYTPDEESTFSAWITISGANYQDLSPGVGVITGELTLIDPARPISDSEKARDSLIDPSGTLIAALDGIDGLEVESSRVQTETLDASVGEAEPVGVASIEFTAIIQSR